MNFLRCIMLHPGIQLDAPIMLWSFEDTLDLFFPYGTWPIYSKFIDHWPDSHSKVLNYQRASFSIGIPCQISRWREQQQTMPMFSTEKSMESIAYLNEAFNVSRPKQRGKDLGGFQADGPGGFTSISPLCPKACMKKLNQLPNWSMSNL